MGLLEDLEVVDEVEENRWGKKHRARQDPPVDGNGISSAETQRKVAGTSGRTEALSGGASKDERMEDGLSNPKP